MRNKGRVTYPSYYRTNVARNIERRYLKERKTKDAMLNEKRVLASSEVSRYIQLALASYLTEDNEAKLDKIAAVNTMVDTLSKWYVGITNTQGIERAKKLLSDRVDSVFPDSFFAPSRLAKDEEELTHIRMSAELTSKIYCLALHTECGYSRDDLTVILQRAKRMYEIDCNIAEDEEKNLKSEKGQQDD